MPGVREPQRRFFFSGPIFGPAGFSGPARLLTIDLIGEQWYDSPGFLCLFDDYWLRR